VRGVRYLARWGRGGSRTRAGGAAGWRRCGSTRARTDWTPPAGPPAPSPDRAAGALPLPGVVGDGRTAASAWPNNGWKETVVDQYDSKAKIR
jgi:hypothetical protein